MSILIYHIILLVLETKTARMLWLLQLASVNFSLPVPMSEYQILKLPGRPACH